MSSSILDSWSFYAVDNAKPLIIPDGCRDIIVEQNHKGEVSYFISPLADSSYTASITSGNALFGFRLEPGCSIDEKGIQQFVTASKHDDLQLGHWINEFCRTKASVKEALEGLRSELPNIYSIAKHLGVSSRTLQRLIKQETGKNPHFWLALVRARRCARLLHQQTPLAEAAHHCSYSDHAHMAREMRRWFNATPSSIRTEESLREVLSPGYD